jgi:hypothetical protein
MQSRRLCKRIAVESVLVCLEADRCDGGSRPILVDGRYGRRFAFAEWRITVRSGTQLPEVHL